MAILIDPETGEEYEVTEEDIIREENYRLKMAKKREEENLPDYEISTGMDGHKYKYPVIGRYEDGRYKTTSFDAIHMDDCLCYNPEKWY